VPAEELAPINQKTCNLPTDGSRVDARDVRQMFDRSEGPAQTLALLLPLRRIDGWRKIAAVLSQQKAVAA